MPIAADAVPPSLVALEHAGILRRVGRTLRFRSDVEGDLLLAYLLEGPARAILEELFRARVGADGVERPLRNLSAAGGGHAATMIRAWLREWRVDFNRLSSQRVRLLAYCAEAAPEDVAEICIDAAHAGRLTSEVVESIVVSLSHSAPICGLRLLGKLALIEGVSFSVAATVKHLVAPAFHSSETLDDAVLQLETWVKEPMPARRGEVVAHALRVLFATVARWHTNDGASMTIHEQPLPAAPRLVAIRRSATRVLEAMFCHADVAVRLQAVAVLDDHGRPHIGRASTGSLRSVISAELESLVPALDRVLGSDREPCVLAKLHAALATRWAAGWPGARHAADLLANRPFDPLVKAYQYCDSHDWFCDFDRIDLLLDSGVVLEASDAIALARCLLEASEVAIRRRGLDCIYYREDIEPMQRLELLRHALRDGDWSGHWEVVHELLERPGLRTLFDEQPRVRQCVEARFVAGPEQFGSDWHRHQIWNLLCGDDLERRLALCGRMIANGSFEALHEAGQNISVALVDAERIARGMEHLVRWARMLGERGLDAVEHLVRDGLGESELPENARALLTQLLESQDVTVRGVAIILLGKMQASSEACAVLAKLAADEADAAHALANRQLWSFRSPRNGWSHRFGEPSPELTLLRRVVGEARDLVSGHARVLVGDVVRQLDQNIEDERRRDEEVLDPR